MLGPSNIDQIIMKIAYGRWAQKKGRILIIVKYTSGSFGIQFDEICGGEHFIEPNSDLMIYSPFYPYQNPTPASAKFLFSHL